MHLAWLRRARRKHSGAMQKAFEDGAFALKVGEMSGGAHSGAFRA